MLLLFAAALYHFSTLEQSFFPDSNTCYYCVDLWSAEGTSINEQEQRTKKLTEFLRSQPEVKNVSEFIGGGGLRFILTYSPPEPDTAFSQLIVEVHNGNQTRPNLLKTQDYINNNMPELQGICRLFTRGSGMTPKLEARFYGEDPAVLRGLAEQARQILEDDPKSLFVRNDWRDPVEVIRPRILKDQMQSLGLTRPLINQAVSMAAGGAAIGAFREGDKSLAIKAAFIAEERNRIDLLRSLPIWAPAANASVPLGTVFSALDVVFEDNIIMRRDRSRVITLASDIKLGENTDAMLKRVRPKVEAIKLPIGYSLEWGGEKERSDNAMSGMATAFIPAVLLMFTIMVFLFNGFKQPMIIFISLPLILIGVGGGIWLFDMNISFTATVGLLSLIGMLAKNSIVLLDQVSSDFAAGRDKYEAIVEDGVSRLRPVAMSALTTVLGMFPLIWDLLFGPMAVTIMSGLTVSTVLTLIVIPVLTAIFYNVECK